MQRSESEKMRMMKTKHCIRFPLSQVGQYYIPFHLFSQNSWWGRKRQFWGQLAFFRVNKSIGANPWSHQLPFNSYHGFHLLSVYLCAKNFSFFTMFHLTTVLLWAISSKLKHREVRKNSTKVTQGARRGRMGFEPRSGRSWKGRNSVGRVIQPQ